jgi:hypothetical protein
LILFLFKTMWAICFIYYMRIKRWYFTKSVSLKEIGALLQRFVCFIY